MCTKFAPLGLTLTSYLVFPVLIFTGQYLRYVFSRTPLFRICFQSKVLNQRLLLSLFCRLPYINSMCLCTFIYFAFGFCHIPVHLPVCFPHPVGLVTSLISRARFNPYFISDNLVHVLLLYLLYFHIIQYVTIFSIPVFIMFSFAVASHRPNCRLSS